jgi:hypothetical protein
MSWEQKKNVFQRKVKSSTRSYSCEVRTNNWPFGLAVMEVTGELGKNCFNFP